MVRKLNDDILYTCLPMFLMWFFTAVICLLVRLP
jgi:hypothetical protein